MKRKKRKNEGKAGVERKRVGTKQDQKRGKENKREMRKEGEGERKGRVKYEK